MMTAGSRHKPIVYNPDVPPEGVPLPNDFAFSKQGSPCRIRG